jgi:mono/diheme cytochrome c family protein
VRLSLSIAIPLAGLALLLGVADAAVNPRSAITSAAVAPYRDELLRDAPALCADLTPAAAAAIVANVPPGTSCEQAAQQIFAATVPSPLNPGLAPSLRASASDLLVNGQRATGTFSLTATTSVERHGTPTVAIDLLGSYRLSLEEVAGRWLVSSPARLTTIPECQLRAAGCQPGAELLSFSLGVPVLATPGAALSIPAAVRRAGGRELREFKAGRTVLAESGCLACHRIGGVGNRGPGPSLAHVGTRLTPRQLERALRSPRAPMPSFKRLPAAKLHALVRFLSLLR